MLVRIKATTIKFLYELFGGMMMITRVYLHC